MTFKAKPVVKRAQRPSREGQDRRNLYLNIGFGLVVFAAVLILVVAGALTWYNDHLAAVGSVDGQQITKDELRDRFEIDSWRLDEAQRRIRTAIVAGQLTDAQGQQQLDSISQTRQQLSSTALERVIDSKLQAKLAIEEGLTTTPADVDAKLLEEATTPEQRRSWVIEFAPKLDAGAAEPTAAQKNAARTAAEAALEELQGGKAWEDVASTVSTDTVTAAQGGDLGWLQADDTQIDQPFLAALFAAAANTPTEIIEGDDGIYRIGRVTEISPEAVDDTYEARLANDGIDVTKYRAVVLADVVRQKLQDKIVAEVTQPGPQRRVQEIYIKQAEEGIGTDAVKTRHILYSPNNDPSSASTIAEDDPAWAAAKAEAQGAYDRLVANPDLFDSIARTESDEASAQGSTGTGGKLPYFDSSSQVDEAFKAAILAPGLEAGQILEPVRSSFGWHVIQVMYFPPDLDRMNLLKTKANGGASFADLARDNSEAASAGEGGDFGWVARGQIDKSLVDAIFAAPIGEMTPVVTVEGDGLYLYKVLEEEVRTPQGQQLEDLRTNAFSDWYKAKKDAVVIDRGDGATDLS